jgi:hypothetical protein
MIVKTKSGKDFEIPAAQHVASPVGMKYGEEYDLKRDEDKLEYDRAWLFIQVGRLICNPTTNKIDKVIAIL